MLLGRTLISLVWFHRTSEEKLSAQEDMKLNETMCSSLMTRADPEL